jgi:hypothetical protein
VAGPNGLGNVVFECPPGVRVPCECFLKLCDTKRAGRSHAQTQRAVGLELGHHGVLGRELVEPGRPILAKTRPRPARGSTVEERPPQVRSVISSNQLADGPAQAGVIAVSVVRQWLFARFDGWSADARYTACRSNCVASGSVTMLVVSVGPTGLVLAVQVLADRDPHPDRPHERQSGPRELSAFIPEVGWQRRGNGPGTWIFKDSDGHVHRPHGHLPPTPA